MKEWAQELGFSLSEVTDLPRLRDGRRECAEVKRVAEAKIAAVEQKIRQLSRMRDALKSLLSSCGEKGRGPCPIIETFEEETDA